MLNALESWTYGRDPWEYLRFEVPLQRLKHAVQGGTRVLRDAVAKYLVRNKHRVIVTLVPDTGE